MLNISNNSINERVKIDSFKSYQSVKISNSNRLFIRWLLSFFVAFLIFLFLPWTQNIQSKGKVTVLRPEHRPQTIHSALPGRIEKWFVQEGQAVKAGDTIVFLSEIKDDYFDPLLVERTEQQVQAKSAAIGAYANKVTALGDQIGAMRLELDFKEQQLRNKVQQSLFKVASDSIELVRAQLENIIAERQWKRADTLYGQGIVSLKDVEDKRVKLQETTAKLIASDNKLLLSRNELVNARLELNTVLYEYKQKIAKAESDQFGTLSDQLDAQATVSKLSIQASNYLRRTGLRFITAPQDGIIAKALQVGIGETIKEGAAIVSILPADYELAVEIYIRPMDFPLVKPGKEVRFIFDGWPAFIFSGWPGASFGTFQGEIVAIDNIISENGRYRLLVAPGNKNKTWPKALRPGSGANGIIMLSNVPLWYELWRQLNGFPPEYYDPKAEGSKRFKWEAPIKSIK
ncbi:MAG: HlyD family secretion protein [Saprospiraceae bacterium]|jgi:adhesin transport system membrane fusion protein